MELVESNAGIWSVLLLVACAALGYVVYERLDNEPAVPGVDTPLSEAMAAPVSPGQDRADEFRLAAIEGYAEIVERPLFRKTRRPPEPAPEVAEEPSEEVPPEELTAASESYVLIGVIVTPDKRVALLKDLSEGTIERLVDGQRAGEWSVAGIGSDRVSLRRGERVEELELVRGEIPLAQSEKRPTRKSRRGIKTRELSERDKAIERNRAIERKKTLQRKKIERIERMKRTSQG